MNNSILTLGEKQTVSLHDHLQKCYLLGMPSTLNIDIEILSNAVITIIDDLALHSKEPMLKHKITINAGASGIATYQLRLVEGIATPAIEKQLVINLNGQGAHVDAHIACYGKDKQILKINTLQNHVVGDSFSNVMIKTICDDASRFTCNSMIRIHPQAQRSTAEQANKNILLSKQARAVSIPQLEVEANDVRCKHGAAVSTLSNDHLFYLASRGIAPDMARTMLLEGFLI
jgi:hypothetical protein